LPVKETLKGLLEQVGRWSLAGSSGKRVVVLCYHSVHPSKPFASASPEDFGRQLDWLAAHCEVVPLDRILNAVTTPQDRARPLVALTFDDGYADNHEFAFPLLQSRGLTATFFVTVGLLERDAEVVARLQALRGCSYEDVRPLEWAQAREMHVGGMAIGGHTYSHPNLAVLSRTRARDELRRSKAILEDRLGTAARAFAYPFGKPGRHFTEETAGLVEEAGYEYACAVLFRAVRSTDSRFAIPRLFVTQDSLERLRAKVMGAWDLLGVWQERSPLWLAQMVSPVDFKEWP
jgi:peptidoglycan/xylan/chitin deacetylase (PgdA/CDA1 family)